MSTSVEQLLAGRFPGGSALGTLAPVDSGPLFGMTFDQIYFNMTGVGLANSFYIFSGGVKPYFHIDLTPAAQKISFGNGVDNPTYEFLGSGKVTITGDLTVNGTTTTVNSTVVDIADRVVHFNWAAGPGTPVPALITGFSIHRGDIAGVARDTAGCFWQEATGFRFAYNTGADDITVGADVPIFASDMTLSGAGSLVLSAAVALINHTGGTSLTMQSVQPISVTSTGNSVSVTGASTASLTGTAGLASVSGVAATVDGTSGVGTLTGTGVVVDGNGGKTHLKGDTMSANFSVMSDTPMAVGSVVSLLDLVGVGRIALSNATAPGQNCAGILITATCVASSPCIDKVAMAGTMCSVAIEAGHGAILPGTKLYMSATTAGTVTATAPPGATNSVVVVGYSVETWGGVGTLCKILFLGPSGPSSAPVDPGFSVLDLGSGDSAAPALLTRVSNILLIDPAQFSKVGFTPVFTLEVFAKLDVADPAGAVLSLMDVDTLAPLAAPGPVLGVALTTFTATFAVAAIRRIALFCVSIAGGGTLYSSANVKVTYT